MRNKLSAIVFAAAILFSVASASAQSDPNGDRPGLTFPPLDNSRPPETVTVPDNGNSALLLGAGLAGLGALHLARRRLMSAGA